MNKPFKGTIRSLDSQDNNLWPPSFKLQIWQCEFCIMEVPRIASDKQTIWHTLNHGRTKPWRINSVRCRLIFVVPPSCHPSCIQNFQVPSRFSQYLCTRVMKNYFFFRITSNSQCKLCDLQDGHYHFTLYSTSEFSFKRTKIRNSSSHSVIYPATLSLADCTMYW